MALYVDHQQQTQQTQQKHYCRICKKSFACGQALGGHMRAHGINDNISYMDDDDEDDEEDDHMSNSDWTPNANSMYSLRTNPNRLKSCRVCENCGEEFSSWKSFLEHGKCNLGEANSGSELEEGLPKGDYNYNSSKRKRSYRAKVGNIISYNSPWSEEEDLAHCLMMLSKGIAYPSSIVQPEESCASASKIEGRMHNLNSPYHNYGYKISSQYEEKTKLENPKILFECKACKKVFNSHQALGGHRASHKKVKGCFAAKLDYTNEANQGGDGMVTIQEELHQTKLQYYHNGSSSLKEKKKEKVHECSICYRVFSSGQALGGHKRCHWITSKNSPDHATHSTVNNQFYNQAKVVAVAKDSKTLDLSFHALDAKPKNNQNSQEMILLPWAGGEDSCGKDKIFTVKDNIETKTKFDTLTELKDLTTSETSSQWLQIGLGSTSSQVGSD